MHGIGTGANGKGLPGTNLAIVIIMLLSAMLVSSCGEKTTSELIDQLATGDTQSRSDAATELADRGDNTAVAPLIMALDDKEMSVRVKAAGALGHLKNPEAVTPLSLHLVTKDDTRGELTRAAALALQEIGDPRALDSLMAVVGVAGGAQAEVKSAIRHFGAAAIPSAVVQVMNSTSSASQAAEILRDIGPPAVDPVAPYLVSDNPSVCVKAIDLLGTIGDPRAAAPIASLLSSDNPTVRASAAKALGAIGPQAADALISVLSNGNDAARVQAIDLLGRWKEPRAVEALAAVLANGNPAVRKGAANALGYIRDARAVPSLITVLGDPSEDVRWAAADALVAMPSGTETLVAAINSYSLEVIAGAYPFYIRKGIPGSEPVLNDALDSFGYETMAEDYLNCGNDKLESAAEAWAHRNGYRITHSYGAATGPKWGSG